MIAVLDLETSRPVVHQSIHPFFTPFILLIMNQKPLFQYGAPKGDSLEPPKSSKAILAVCYELHPGFIAMV